MFLLCFTVGSTTVLLMFHMYIRSGVLCFCYVYSRQFYGFLMCHMYIRSGVLCFCYVLQSGVLRFF